MAFNSFPFLVFIFIFFLLWPLFRKRQNLKFLFLVFSSFIFYGWWDWRFLFLIFFSGLVDFFAAKMISSDPKRSKRWLFISIVINLTSLSVFKYSAFFAEQLEQIFAIFSVTVDLSEKLPEFTFILPVGISFYTFQSMSYTIDVYRNKLKPTSNILHFFSYLVMFPQLVAGPIVRAKDFLYQLNRNRKLSGIELWNGIKLIIIGYFQKVVLADNLAVLVDDAFSEVYNGFGFYWWVVMLCFSFQIYFDFSGYTLIARGLAKLMGYHFKMNFNHPYSANSLRDFWSRWHISLSTWFRDYVYIPLGGSKKGMLRTHINLWATMILSGLWHGAQINFVLWGVYHAAILSLERILKKPFAKEKNNIPKIVSWLGTMVLVIIGWVFFRSNSFNQATGIIKNLFVYDLNTDFISRYQDCILFLICAIFFECLYLVFNKQYTVQKIFNNKHVEPILYAIAIVSIIFLRGPEKEFIYFQF